MRAWKTTFFTFGLLAPLVGCGLVLKSDRADRSVQLIGGGEVVIEVGCDAMPNGCGPDGLLELIIPDCPLGDVCFRNACNAHDLCYGSCGSLRLVCDTRFLFDLTDICSMSFGASDPHKLDCLALAYVYWQAVVRFGGPFYNLTQLPACVCAGYGLKMKDQNDKMSKSQNVGWAPPTFKPFEDADDDLLPDEWETRMGLNPTDPADAMIDSDGDGFNNLEEFIQGTIPHDEHSTPGEHGFRSKLYKKGHHKPSLPVRVRTQTGRDRKRLSE